MVQVDPQTELYQYLYKQNLNSLITEETSAVVAFVHPSLFYYIIINLNVFQHVL